MFCDIEFGLVLKHNKTTDSTEAKLERNINIVRTSCNRIVNGQQSAVNSQTLSIHFNTGLVE